MGRGQLARLIADCFLLDGGALGFVIFPIFFVTIVASTLQFEAARKQLKVAFAEDVDVPRAEPVKYPPPPCPNAPPCPTPPLVLPQGGGELIPARSFCVPMLYLKHASKRWQYGKKMIEHWDSKLTNELIGVFQNLCKDNPKAAQPHPNDSKADLNNKRVFCDFFKSTHVRLGGDITGTLEPWVAYVLNIIQRGLA